jgi:hypothetical protein
MDEPWIESINLLHNMQEQRPPHAKSGKSTLHPMYFPPKKKYKKVEILYFFWKKNLGFDF